MSEASRPALSPRGEEKIFFEHLTQHKLVFQRCVQCQAAVFPLRIVCPQCSCEDLELNVSSGKGVVYSFTTQHRAAHPFFADQVPYTLLLADMAEGFRVFANLIDGTEDDIQVGSDVEAVFDDVEDDLTLLRLRPVANSGGAK